MVRIPAALERRPGIAYVDAILLTQNRHFSYLLFARHDMNASVKHFASFTLMTVLVFTGNGLLGMMGGDSSGPNVDGFVGLPGWLWVHRGSDGISIEEFNFSYLVASICLSILTTFYLSWQLHETRANMMAKSV